MTKHLSEEEIQEAASGTMMEAAVSQHLEHCADCTKQLAFYQLLFSEVRLTEKPAFDFDLSAAVVAQLPARKTTPEKFPFYLVFISSSLLLAGFCALYWDDLVYWFSGSQALIQLCIAIVVLMVLIFQATDLIKRYQKKLRALDFY